MASYTRSSMEDDRGYLMRELSSVQSSAAVRGNPLIAQLRTLVPFDNISVSGLDLDGCKLGEGVFLACDLPGDFIRTYGRERFIEVDPLVKLASPSTPVARWDAVAAYDSNDDRTQSLLKALHEFDIPPRVGITFWRGERLYGAAVFTRIRPFTEGELATLQLFAEPLHKTLADPVIAKANKRFRLTDGEIRCLDRAAAGLTAEDIAADVGYTPETVATYLKSAIHKLGAANRTEAVAIALRRRIIK